MKPSKRVKHALSELHKIKELVMYTCAGDVEHYNKFFKMSFQDIEETLVSLAEDKKLFSIKLKKVWDEQNN